jgi:hypothetical protein
MDLKKIGYKGVDLIVLFEAFMYTVTFRFHKSRNYLDQMSNLELFNLFRKDSSIEVI